MKIKGEITRLLAPGEVWIRPDAGVDLRNVDTKHRRASGELVGSGALEGRKLGQIVELELSADGAELAVVEERPPNTSSSPVMPWGRGPRPADWPPERG